MDLLKLSELIAMLHKAKAEFGDIPVGAYSAEYCYELGKPEDLMPISLRVMAAYASSSADKLPGVDLLSGEQEPSSKFLAIFYRDDQ